ncbi:MAG: hypothetical protein M3P30_03525 [Chloroflexota bacterium]|nr:hypothetical protein [Chloroflexota bacterium]
MPDVRVSIAHGVGSMHHLDLLSAAGGRVMDVLLIAAIAVLVHEARSVIRRSSMPEPVGGDEPPAHAHAGASDGEDAAAATRALYREAHRLYLARGSIAGMRDRDPEFGSLSLSAFRKRPSLAAR